MKRLSIAPSASRRKSGISLEDQKARQELEQLDQDTTLVLQGIDKSLSRANAIINGKLKSVLQEYIVQSSRINQHCGFWKKFFESSANVVLDSYEAPIAEVNDANLLHDVDGVEDVGGEEGEEEEEYEEEERQGGSLKPFSGSNVKNPHVRAIIEEGSPTWSTEQTNLSKATSSTPQRSGRSGGQQRTRFALGNDIIKGTKLMETVNLQHPSSNVGPRQSPPERGSPIRIQTIRRSLDAYQRVSISPRKYRTPISSRSEAMQSMLNSSPTFPEPPVLKSDIPSEASRLPNTTSPHRSSDVEPHLRRFPNTPKYAGIGSGSSHGTPLVRALVRDEGDSGLQPPQLETSSQISTHAAALIDSESSSEQLPVFNTIELTSSGRRQAQVEKEPLSKRRRVDDADGEEEKGKAKKDEEHEIDKGDLVDEDEEGNVFYEKKDRMSPEGNENPEGEDASHSKSISQIYAEEISKFRHQEYAGGEVEETEAVEEITVGANQDGNDITEGSTADLGPLKERWKYFSAL
ncbi:uncharacterized protein LODBEIA_P50110 [Lodderomyces beijingensis]|uniref:DASH complex subunit ASK1 n=1 Tax=Lodderomyces beijingensis TaxID=1775926 RepID=A0ABP0ZVT4_9ASCO